MNHSNEKQTSYGSYCGLCCTKIKDLSVTYGNTEILKDINLHIHCGELTALIGPNGAGKSTLLKAILGEIKHSGKMKFLDMKNVHTRKPLIGYVPQHLDFDKSSPISVSDIFTACLTDNPVWLFKHKQIRKQTEDSLKIVQAEHLINKRLGSLSGGELQRVLLALALVPLPDLLLLDEPVSGIDQNGLELFYNIVSELRKNYDMSIILVSHDLNLVAQHSDRVVLLNKSIQAVGLPEEVLNEDCLTKVFGKIWFKYSVNKPKNEEQEDL
ncbi:MAG: metal ABC transporter ATP-binding protein [bacterium]